MYEVAMEAMNHASACYVAVFDGPSLCRPQAGLCKIIVTGDDSMFLTVEFAPEDGLPLLVTAMKTERVLKR